VATTTTFLFTDIEGSSRLWETHEAAMRTALADHDRVICQTVEANRGRVFSHMGDGVAAEFPSAIDAVRAAAEIQRQLLEADHREIGRLLVRMGLHSGEAEERDGDFFGPTVNRAARIMSAGHGGQIVVSEVTRRLAEPGGLEFIDLGEHRLRDLGRPETIHQLTARGLSRDFPPLRTLTEAANNLPVQLTSFVGRDEELTHLLRLLGGSRLVTITGVGGVGKTRVALQAAGETAPLHPDGVWLIALAPVSDPEGVDSAFLDALSVPQSDMEARDALIEYLSDRKALLVVDNCEHLIDATATTVDAILTAAPEIKVLATSRELLGVPGEAALGLRSMTLPEDAADPTTSDAVRLLLERAGQAKPGFLSDGHEEAITEICRRLDGIPLALELAAARLRTFSPERVAGLLDESFRLLTGGSRTAVPRQRTLEAAIEWSHRLLVSDERELFRMLAVFGGGFTVESAQAVCAGGDIDEFTVLELLSALVDKSLVATDEGEIERFHLLETIRQYASARLEETGDADALRRRHAVHFRALVEEAAEMRWGPDGAMTRRRVRAERDNLRQAMTWALEANDGELALDLALGFARFGDEGRWSEPLMWYRRALDVAGEPPDDATRAVRLHRLASVEAESPDTTRAVEHWNEAVAIFDNLDDGSDDPEWLLDFSIALLGLAVVRFYRGEGGDRNEHFRAGVRRALAVARRVGHLPMIAVCLGNLAHHVDPDTDPGEVRELFDEAEQARRRVGDPGGVASVLWQRARYEFYAGDMAASVQAWQSAIEEAQRGGLEDSIPRYRVGSALAELESGDDSAGARIDRAIQDVLAASDAMAGSQAISQTMLVARASSDSRSGRHHRVAIAAGASDTETERDVPVPWDLAPHWLRLIEAAEEALGAEAEALRAEGAAMTREDIAVFLTEPV
jgi:predicted ATPase/class 3 adenylate cyclase